MFPPVCVCATKGQTDNQIMLAVYDQFRTSPHAHAPTIKSLQAQEPKGDFASQSKQTGFTTGTNSSTRWLGPCASTNTPAHPLSPRENTPSKYPHQKIPTGKIMTWPLCVTLSFPRNRTRNRNRRNRFPGTETVLSAKLC